MWRRVKNALKGLDLSDIRLLILGCFLLLSPLIYFVLFSGVRDKTLSKKGYTPPGIGRQSAFDLTAKTSVGHSAAPRRGGGSTLSPRAEKIDNELEAAWRKIQATQRNYTFPPDTPPETRLMIEAEEDETMVEANVMLDNGNLAEAEKLFNKVISESKNNTFKELHAWGGLMEVYQLQGDKAKFRAAFAQFALNAQKLKHIYGPLADDISRAYQLFDQIAHVDSGKLREFLTKANLAQGTKVNFDEFMKSINDTKEWFPGDISKPEPAMPYSRQN